MRNLILGARRYVWLIALSLGLVTIVAVRTASLWRQGATLKAWHSLGQHNIDLIAYADAIEIYRIENADIRNAKKLVGGFPVIGVSHTPSSALQKQTAETLLNVFNTQPYNWDQSSCEFNPGVAFRFHKGAEILDAVVCYDCAAIVLSTQKNGRLRRGAGTENFGSEYENMYAIAKAAFPDDAEIQKLRSP